MLIFEKQPYFRLKLSHILSKMKSHIAGLVESDATDSSEQWWLV
jgi:hypothetical protein